MKPTYTCGIAISALEVTTRLGLEDSGGMVRVGPVRYNTVEESNRFGEILRKIAENG